MIRIDTNVDPEKWEDWMLRHWLRCPDCAATMGRSLYEAPPPLSPEEEARGTAELLATAFPLKRTSIEDDARRWEKLLLLSRDGSH